MKRILVTIIATIVALVAVPNTAEARTGSSYTYVSGRASCGCAIYTKRVIRGYDRYHRPVYSYYRQPFRCGCRSRVTRHGYSSRYVTPRATHSRTRVNGTQYRARTYTPTRSSNR